MNNYEVEYVAGETFILRRNDEFVFIGDIRKAMEVVNQDESYTLKYINFRLKDVPNADSKLVDLVIPESYL